MTRNGLAILWCRQRIALAGEGNGQDVEADDPVKVPEIGCSGAPSGRYGGRRDEPVGRSDVVAGGGESGPDAGVRTSGEKAGRQRGNASRAALMKASRRSRPSGGGAVHIVQQAGSRDGGDAGPHQASAARPGARSPRPWRFPAAGAGRRVRGRRRRWCPGVCPLVIRAGPPSASAASMSSAKPGIRQGRAGEQHGRLAQRPSAPRTWPVDARAAG